MELSRESFNHILEPIGYTQIRKIVKRGAQVRSAYDQYTIHLFACTFDSCILHFPKVYAHSDNSYTMEHHFDLVYVPEEEYTKHPLLISELIRFFQYMTSNGYWPTGFSVFQTGSTYLLLDFSRFGYTDGRFVRFPKQRIFYDFDEAYMLFAAFFFEDDDDDQDLMHPPPLHF